MTARLQHPLAVRFSLLLLMGFALSSTPVLGQSAAAPERFRAFAVDLNDSGQTRSGFVDIVINRWPTKAEHDTLLGALDRGQDAFVKALMKARRVGYIQTPDSIGWGLHYVQVVPGKDGGRTITLMTERPIGFWEAVDRPPSIAYPLMWIELRLDSNGEGEGTMFLAAKASGSLKHRFMVMENFTTQGVRLTNVRTVRRPT